MTGATHWTQIRLPASAFNTLDGTLWSLHNIRVGALVPAESDDPPRVRQAIDVLGDRLLVGARKTVPFRLRCRVRAHCRQPQSLVSAVPPWRNGNSVPLRKV